MGAKEVVRGGQRGEVTRQLCRPHVAVGPALGSGVGVGIEKEVSTAGILVCVSTMTIRG